MGKMIVTSLRGRSDYGPSAYPRWGLFL